MQPTTTTKISTSSPAQLLSFSPYNHMPEDQYHQKLFERLVNILSDVYLLPDDEEEDHRLRAECRVLETCFADVYAKVDQYLQPQPGAPLRRCLDVGSARGDWIDQIAGRCKNAQFTGVDLCPSRRPSGSLGAPRVKFDIHDVNTGFDQYHNQFDVVHVRNLTHGIERFNDLMSGAADSLRSGGLGVFIEWDYKVYSPSRDVYTCSTASYNPAKSTPGFGQVAKPRTEQVPALVHFLQSVTRASSSAGSHINSVSYLKTFVERTGCFRDVVQTDIWVPVVTHNADPQERKIADQFRPVFVGFLNSCGPLLRSHAGLTPPQLSALEDSARIEIMGCKTPIYVRFLCVTGVKA